MTCTLTNLADCIPQKIAEYIVYLLNLPLSPLLEMTKKLLTEPVSIELFRPLWKIIIVIISFFYGIVFLYAGMQLLFFSFSPERREMAKEQLRNAVFMLVLVQLSFFLYSLLIEMGAALSHSALSMVDARFFLLTADNVVNFGLQLVFVALYLIVLIITVLLLGIRYVLVSIGVILFPVGIFLTYFTPTKPYGKMVLHVLAPLILLPAIAAFIIVGVSLLMSIALFENMKILLTIVAFVLVDTIIIFGGKIAVEGVTKQIIIR